jgi:hypothetical protein
MENFWHKLLEWLNELRPILANATTYGRFALFIHDVLSKLRKAEKPTGGTVDSSDRKTNAS